MLLLLTFPSGESGGSDTGKKTYTKNVKDPSSFEIWIFRNGEPDGNDDHIICVPIAST